MQNRGYAYSDAPNNAPLVTDSLANRLKDALAQKLFANMDKNLVEMNNKSTKIGAVDSS